VLHWPPCYASYQKLEEGKPEPQNQKAMRPRHVAVVREALRKTSLNKDKYGSYSIHKKVTTMEAPKSTKHCIIKTLGQ